MRRKTIYESVGSSYADDWMAQERRYEAKHSPWELDDNAAYLDEEHRKHCEAREARRAHERECEVKRPDYQQQTEAKLKNAAGAQLTNNRKTTSSKPADESEIAKVILIILAASAFIGQLFI